MKQKNSILWRINVFLVVMLISVASSVMAVSKHKSCAEDLTRQKQRSSELQDLANEDQADRQVASIDWDSVSPRDEKRASRVGAIFGEGCIVSGPDYSAAALIFQHGSSVDHNFQSYLWAKKALELGDSSRKGLMFDGIDRFLVRQGYMQFFGGQTRRIRPQRCRCIEDIEPGFSDAKRTSMGGRTLAVMIKEITDFNAFITGCADVQFCGGLKTPPPGIIPGVW